MACNQEILRTKANELSNLISLCEGGYGLVYKARHCVLGTVAYKKLHAHHIKNEDEAELKREAQIQSQLNHPNIVKLVSLVFEPGNYGLVLEYMEFGEILEYITKYNPIWETKLYMIHGIVRGLCYLHSLKTPIIHGDLKTQNILLDENLCAKICDFGFAYWRQYSQSHSHKNVRLGTATHIPPEAWKDQRLRRTESFDVYSLGICLWEILTVQKPFEIMVPCYIKEMVLDNKRPNIDLVPSDISKRMKSLIERCWNHEAQRRPTAFQIKTEIESEIHLVGRGVSKFFKQESCRNRRHSRNKEMSFHVCIIDYKNLTLISKISGSIFLGSYERDGLTRLVAVKAASRTTDTSTDRMDVISEAVVISKLHHKHVIGFIGVCLPEKLPTLLALEYASIGSLDVFLQKHSTFPIGDILELLIQVAMGMAYLEENRIVHGCLAAKNILLTTTHCAKVSNFSRSNILAIGQTFCSKHMCATNNLRWIPPECHNSNRLSYKSDAWNFGMLTWEALSNGRDPFERMKDDEIVEFMNAGKRLPDPIICTDEFKRVIHDCCRNDYDNRPSFSEIVQYLGRIKTVGVLEECTTKLNTTLEKSMPSKGPKFSTSNQLINRSTVDKNSLTFITTITHEKFPRTDLFSYNQSGNRILIAGRICVREYDAGIDTMKGIKEESVLREARLLSSIKHPFIIQFVGICKDGGEVIVITEYAILGSMEKFLKQNLKTPMKHILKLMYQVAQGMAFLEKKGIVHCNVSARNIYLLSEKHAKISNFKYCRETTNDRQTCKVMKVSSRQLMAPESLKNQEISSKLDVFCFGITQWECMSYNNAIDIQKLFEDNHYLKKPCINCPSTVYLLMRQCWLQLPEDRPSFPNIISSYQIVFDENNIDEFVINSNIETNVSLIESSLLSLTGNYQDGCFGRIHFSYYKKNRILIPVGVQFVLDSDRIIPALPAFVHEVQMASKLRHIHITRYCGIQIGQQRVSLVLQSSELGSLKNYIVKHPDVPTKYLVQLMYQVSQGMVYLQQNRVINLSLSASSLYLISEHHITIGNFRFSKQLDKKAQTYRFQNGVAFPTIWTAPECVKESVANFKSDVWSFGVTLWESLNGGNIPDSLYQMIEKCERKAKLPSYTSKHSTDTVYDMMTKCWQNESDKRPTFTDLLQMLEYEMRRRFEIDSKTLTGLGNYNESVSETIVLAKQTPIKASSLLVLRHLHNNFATNVDQINLMLNLGHKHLVDFVGYYNSHTNLAIAVQEYATFGPLDVFLREHPSYHVNNLIHISYQVASGMAYLEEKCIVHLDLRTKNIRLSSPYHVKIDNFQLSKQLFPSYINCDCCDYEDFRDIGDSISQRVKWAAPESLENNMADTKSDVWSFAVTTWEIMSRGAQPYDNCTLDEICFSIVNHNLLERPAECSETIYDLLRECWNKNKSKRPTFKYIENFFAAISEPFNKDVEYRIDPSIKRLNKINFFVDSSRVVTQSRPTVLCAGMFGPILTGIYYSPTKSGSRSGSGITKVSLKTILTSNDIREASLVFQRESEIMFKLKHDNIIKCHGINTCGKPMLIIESFAFGPLDRYLIGKKRFPEEQILTLMQQVASGMCHMRKCRIVHQNLRAANILLVSEVHAKISNFEFSAEFNKGQNCIRYNEGQTSLRWTAPECLKSHKFYFKSDVWSFGVTLWEAVSYGAEPYQGRTEEDVRREVLDHKLLLRPNSCRDALYDLMLNCWRKEIEERPAFVDIVTVLLYYI